MIKQAGICAFNFVAPYGWLLSRKVVGLHILVTPIGSHGAVTIAPGCSSSSTALQDPRLEAKLSGKPGLCGCWKVLLMVTHDQALSLMQSASTALEVASIRLRT